MNLEQGVAILPAQSLVVSSSYQDLAQTKFGVLFQSLRYQDPYEAIGTINRWVQAQTGDKVQKLVSNMDVRTQLLLATVAYYQSMYRQSEGGVSSQRAGSAVRRRGFRSTPRLTSCFCSSPVQPGSVRPLTRPSPRTSVSTWTSITSSWFP